MEGFSGLKAYQDFRRKDVMRKGYILINPLTGHKAFIHDFEELKEIKSKFTPDFWNSYKELKTKSPDCDVVQDVKRFFKRKSSIEKASINYPIQGFDEFPDSQCFFPKVPIGIPHFVFELFTLQHMVYSTVIDSWETVIRALYDPFSVCDNAKVHWPAEGEPVFCRIKYGKEAWREACLIYPSEWIHFQVAITEDLPF